MSESSTLVITDLRRLPEHGDEDALSFGAGVNVIVGPPNTGKTKWLRMLDYLFGDPDSPESVFGDDLAEKYESVCACLRIGSEDATVERRWKEPGSKTKVFVNGKPLDVSDFQLALLEKLGIPAIHYPQGNPLGPRTWPLLGWRTLYRHVFRRQEYWSDIADKQPESEQHACLLQFLGAAEHRYPREYADLASSEKQIMQLQNSREQFVAMLQEVTHEIIEEKELGVALTPESLDAAIERIQADAEDLREERDRRLRSLAGAAVADLQESAGPGTTESSVDDLTRQVVDQQAEDEAMLAEVRKTEDRLRDMYAYRDLISDEVARMDRARAAGSELTPLRITHCPACDREVSLTDLDASACFLCGRPLPQDQCAGDAEDSRLAFEHEQLQADLRESQELIAALENELGRLRRERSRLAECKAGTQELLRPVRVAAAAILPPEICIADTRIGQLHEKVRQLERVKAALDRRGLLADRIAELQGQIAQLEASVAEMSSTIEYERLGDTLADGMNQYLNQLVELAPGTWSQQQVGVRLEENRFSMQIGGSPWKAKLGGTLTIYFLLAYHYSLMSLTHIQGMHYPGLSVLNFPAEVEGSNWKSDEENFVLEPFVSLLAEPTMSDTQVIAVGRSFESLEGANRIELSRIWT